MNARHMATHLGAQVVLLLAVAALLSLLSPSPSQAKDAPASEAKLLLKCGPQDVQRVLAALAHLRVQVYDLETMEKLHAPGKPGALTPLPSATDAMAALHAGIAAATKDGAGEWLRLVELQVTPQRVMVGIELADQAVADAIPAALAKHPYFADRAVQIELGAMARKGSRWTLRLSMKLSPLPEGEKPLPRGVEHISSLQLHRLELASRLQRTYAGAERVVFDRQRGVRTISRELTYQSGSTLDDLVGFLDRIARETDLTVIDLRWKRIPANPGENKLGKIVLRVAVMTLLGG